MSSHDPKKLSARGPGQGHRPSTCRGKARAILMLGLTIMTSCSKLTTSSSGDSATPHPALPSREIAVRMYPALGVPGSPFNLAFIDLFEKTKQTSPDTLTSDVWPILLANKTAAILGVHPATPKPSSDLGRTSLDQGAYGLKRSGGAPGNGAFDH